MATITVTTNLDVVDADDGVTSLREAVELANANADADMINFALPLGQTITLTGSELMLMQDATIDGGVNGDNKADITISGNNASRIFNGTGAGTDVELLSLTMTNGRPADVPGGAISFTGLSLDLRDVTERDRYATRGGGVYTTAPTTFTNSAILDNAASAFGGGVIVISTTATFVNTTIDGNTANHTGGGISIVSGSILTVTNRTITGNTAQLAGGGIDLYEGSAATITNSVIALNTSDRNASVAQTGAASTLTAQNSFFGTTLAIDTGANNINNGGDPGLGALADNGGTVMTPYASHGQCAD
jgi:hypothetical protein